MRRVFDRVRRQTRQVIWNRGDASQYIVLYDSDRTATVSGASGWRCVRATLPRASGRWFIGLEIVTKASSFAFGLAWRNASLDDGFAGMGIAAVGWWSAGRLYYNGGYVGISQFYTGDFIGIGLDCHAPGAPARVSFYRNGVLVGEHTTGFMAVGPVASDPYQLGAYPLISTQTSEYARLVSTWGESRYPAPNSYGWWGDPMP